MQETDAQAAQAAPARLLIYVALAVVVLVAHGGSLFDGVRHDDHLHRDNLRTMGWSWHDLIECTTFELPGRQMHFWWQSVPVQWRYPRPVTMSILKAEQLLVGAEPIGMHAFSLAWHLLNCILLYHLARRIFPWRWALLAGILFAVNPNSALTVSWTAAHNALISNAGVLAALLLYIRATRDPAGRPAPLRIGVLAAAVATWMMALFSREAAIVFPALVVAWDLCFGGWPIVWSRWRMYIILAAIAVAYIAWRFFIFATGGMPAGYMNTPHGAGYVWWAVNKWLQAASMLMLHLPLYAPIDYAETWNRVLLIAHIVLLGAFAIVLIMYARTTRAEPGRWLGPLWMLIGLLPVVPIATMPHFAYLPAIGYALAITTFLRRFPIKLRAANTAATLLLVVGMLTYQRYVVRMQIRAEQLVVADVLQTAPPPARGSTLFFVNLPLPASFTVYALREAWHNDLLTGYALSLADTVYAMDSRSRVERVGERELELTRDPPGWFHDPLERWFLKLTGRRTEFQTGDVIRGELFDTTIVEAVDGGVTRMRFAFHDTLDRPDWYFYMATPERPMQRIRFDRHDVAADALETAAFQTRYAAWLSERDIGLRVKHWLEERFPSLRPKSGQGDHAGR